MRFGHLAIFLAVFLCGCGVNREVNFTRPSAGFNSVPAELRYHLLMGEFAIQRGKPGVAALEYSRAAELSGDPEIARRATRIAFQAGVDDYAMRAAKRWLLLAQDSMEPHHYLALLELRMGRNEAAIPHFERIVEGETGLTVAENFNTVTGLLSRENRPAGGVTIMQRLVELYPDVAEGHYGLALLALAAHNTILALSAAERALELKPEWQDALVLHARARIVNGEKDDALGLVEARLTAAPDDYSLRYAYAGLLLQLQRNDEARDEFTKLVQQVPGNADSLFALGLLALDGSDYAEAKTYFGKLLRTGLRPQDAFYYLGVVAEKEEKLREAADWYRRVTTGGRVLDAQVRIAYVMVELDQLQTGRTFLSETRRRYPSQRIPLYMAEAEMLAKFGTLEDAYGVYANALVEFAGNTELIYSRALLAAR
ncbi:MAG: tetratricopeptide repeat protein, partial [Gammaproteobacteria bacterium]|nr:tetratricopeptide repeat protein [Gammaproteobacteria bacterium]